MSFSPHDCPNLDFSRLADSPLQRLQSSFLEQANINFLVKRDDLIHPQFGGNKWRKLKHNLIHARKNQSPENHFNTLLTFGGAWSNHIYATAAASKYFGFKSIGIIRGEKYTPLNATQSFAEECGMQLFYINRAEYRKKTEAQYLEKLKMQFGNVYILPEGGSNSLAVRGCSEIVDEINNEMARKNNRPFDVICCASGTGATLAGLISAINSQPTISNQRAIGFSALKGGGFLKKEVETFLNTKYPAANWHIEDRFHFGGYGKINDELVQFIKDFKSQYGIMLDAVYTGKMFYGLFELIRNGEFKPGSTIVAVHSGGLQGNKGFDLSST